MYMNIKYFLINIVFIFCVSGGLKGQPLQQVFRAQVSKIDNYNRLGSSVSVAGNLAVVGLPSDDFDQNNQNKLVNSGAIYIYERDTNGQWKEIQKVVPKKRKVAGGFGQEVHTDGKIIAVGIYSESRDSTGGNIVNAAGAVHLVMRNLKGVWVDSVMLTTPDRKELDQFGTDVVVSGRWLFASAPSQDFNEQGNDSVNNAGAIYIFRQDSIGQWPLYQKVCASNRQSKTYFGEKFAADSQHIVAGAFQDSYDTLGQNSLTGAGSISFYALDSQQIFKHIQKLTAPDRQANAGFGGDIAIQNNLVVIGAAGNYTDSLFQDSILAAGAAYVYEISQNYRLKYIQKICSPHRNIYDIFGSSVAIGKDVVYVGCPFDDYDSIQQNVRTDAGAVYAFKQKNSLWYVSQKIVHQDRYNSDHGGSKLAAEGHILISGAPNKNDFVGAVSYSNAGVVYVFESCMPTLSQVSQDICGAILSPGKKYTIFNSGVYFDTLVNTKGCDSIIRLSVTQLQNRSFDTLMQCHALRSPSGKYLWKASGTYLDTIKNVNGCDSVISVTFTLLSSSHHLNVGKCTSYTSPSGRYIYSKSGLYYDTLNNAKGCDSIISIQFTKLSSTSSITANFCDIYTGPSGRKYSQNGNYLDTIQNYVGCDSVISIQLSKVIVNIGVTNVANGLQANATGVSYQWLDCENQYLPINGANSRLFSPGKKGQYAVQITQSGCKDTSNCYAFQVSNGVGYSHEKRISIYPNPAHGFIYLNVNQLDYSSFYQWYDMQGRLIGKHEINHSENIIPIPGNGLYLLVIQLGNGDRYVEKMLCIENDN